MSFNYDPGRIQELNPVSVGIINSSLNQEESRNSSLIQEESNNSFLRLFESNDPSGLQVESKF